MIGRPPIPDDASPDKYPDGTKPKCTCRQCGYSLNVSGSCEAARCPKCGGNLASSSLEWLVPFDRRGH